MRTIMKIFVNLLTTSRFLLTIIMIILEKNISHIKFILTIALLFLTDFIDGKLARKYNVQTVYGSNMDTIADKALSLGLMLPLIEKIKVIIPIFIGEIIISLINTTAKIIGKKTKSSNIGKIKTWLIAMTIIISYLNLYQLITLSELKLIYIITLIIQTYTIIEYLKYLKNQDIQPRKINKTSPKQAIKNLFDTEYYLKNN